MANYTRVTQIGRGGFGIVEKVRDSAGQLFARKTFAPYGVLTQAEEDKLRQRFIREVRVQQQLGGSEIIPVLDCDLTGNVPWFTMPLADRTYAEQIEADKAVGKVEIEPIADILSALSHLHELGYVHRDLNPNNILLHESRWKLSDFGAVLPPSGATVTLTDVTVIYTERYCSPEQHRDFHRAQAAADIYSFGCILHDLFGTGDRTPYQRHSAPGSMGVIIEKCTELSPLRRPTLIKLRELVLEALIEESGQLAPVDAQFQEWLNRLGAIEQWQDSDYDTFARCFAALEFSERTEGHENDWVGSVSTPFMTRIPTAALERIAQRQDGVAEDIVARYCEWARGTRFLFQFSDTVCTRLEAIFTHGTMAVQGLTFVTLVALASSHRRYYIMRRVVALSRTDQLAPSLAKRLAMELKFANLEAAFRECVDFTEADLANIAPDLAKLCELQ